MIPENQVDGAGNNDGHRATGASTDTGPATVLLGDTYSGLRSAALSSDTPSAQAPEGGLLVRTAWTADAGSDGQLINFDISAVTVPGTKVLVFDPANPDGNIEQAVPETQLNDFRIASDGPLPASPICPPSLPPLPPPLSSTAPIGMGALAALLPVAHVGARVRPALRGRRWRAGD